MTLLDREVYSEQEAARLLRLPTSTLHYWLQGGVRGKHTYPPVLRPQPIDRSWVTWAEFIEAGWLRAYRRAQGVPMRDLRDFIVTLRDELDVAYPLAHRHPLVSGRSLVLQAQTRAGLAPEYRLVDDQLMLTYSGQTFVNQVVWEGDVATGWRPLSEPDSSVVVRPDVRFGRPAVAGVSTLSIWEALEDGASTEEISEDFGLDGSDVRWALAYENAQHAPAA